MKKLSTYLFLRFVIRPHYNAIIRRGLITPETTRKEFIAKLFEEYMEIVVEETNNDDKAMFSEVTDLFFVCANMMYHFWKGSIIGELKTNIKRQQKRGKR